MLGGIGKGEEKEVETFYFAWCGGDGWEEGGGGYYSAWCGCGECLPNMICMSDDC